MKRAIVAALCLLFICGCGPMTWKATSGHADTHIGKAFGLVWDTQLFIGLGFDEAHTDADADLEASGEYVPEDETQPAGIDDVTGYSGPD